MSYMIVSDSSSNVLDMHDEHYRTAPLHIMVDGVNWPDSSETDIIKFNDALDNASGGVSTSCPSPDEWLNAFGDADEVYCFTISRNLSGSFNSAMAAKHEYEESHEGRHVYIIDSLSTGPTMIFMIEMLRELMAKGITGDAAVKELELFRQHGTALIFTLQSIKRLADNGRVNPLLVKAIGVLDLRIIGIASNEGKIIIVGKHRGAAKVLKGSYKQMLKMGYNGGRIIIAHNQNPSDAEALKRMAMEDFGPNVDVRIHQTGALCSFYAEKYGYIVGFDIDENARRHLL